MGLLTYSGITTKVRAMTSHLISDRQFREMAALDNVRGAADYLKQQPAYEDIFSNLDDSKLHRGYIEQLLTLSKYRDFTKLYRFSNLSQRKFLDLYFMHYEIDILKRCLRNIMSHQHTDLDLSMFQDFFDRHSDIDLVKLAQAEDLQEFFSDLEGSAYYDLLASIRDSEHATLFDYELKLELLYFKHIWTVKSKVLHKNEQEVLDQCFGCRMDMLNVQWIYRSKKYYSLPAADIYALLIPINYKLKTDQVRRMVEAGTLDEFFTVLRSTYYGKLTSQELNEQPDLETLYEQIMDRIYNGASRKNPYSIAILDSYLYFKEQELQKIITTIEGIRYGLETNEIIKLVAKN